MGFIKERALSLISKKAAAAGAGIVLLDDPIAQAIVIVAYLLAQAWVDRK